jgi:hypothetical protein
MVLDDVPDYFGIGRVVSMPQQISEVDHFSPVDTRFILLDLIRDCSRRLADNFQQALCQESSPSVRCKLIKACTLHHIFNFGNGFQNVPQPIFNGGRHSEHLNQIVGNSLDNTRLQQVSHRYLRPETRGVLDYMQGFKKLERR